MTVRICHKNSEAEDKRPTAGQLANGEIAVNLHEAGAFLSIKDTAGNVQQVGGVKVSNNSPANPVKGTFWLDSDNNTLFIYDGTQWRGVTGGGGGGGGSINLAEGDAIDITQAGSTYTINVVAGAGITLAGDNVAVDLQPNADRTGGNGLEIVSDKLRGRIASETNLGVVRVDNSTINIDSDGVISVDDAIADGLTFKGQLNITTTGTADGEPTTREAGDLYVSSQTGTITSSGTNWQSLLEGTDTTTTVGDLIVCKDKAGGANNWILVGTGGSQLWTQETGYIRTSTNANEVRVAALADGQEDTTGTSMAMLDNNGQFVRADPKNGIEIDNGQIQIDADGIPLPGGGDGNGDAGFWTRTNSTDTLKPRTAGDKVTVVNSSDAAVIELRADGSAEFQDSVLTQGLVTATTATPFTAYRKTSNASNQVAVFQSNVGGTKVNKIEFFTNGSAEFLSNVTVGNFNTASNSRKGARISPNGVVFTQFESTDNGSNTAFGTFFGTTKTASINGDGGAHFNIGNNDADFRIDGTSDHLFYADASKNYIGIGTNTPTSIVDLRETKTGGATSIRLFNTDNSTTVTQTASIGLSPDGQAIALAGIEAFKANSNFSLSADRDVDLALNTLVGNAKKQAVLIKSNGTIQLPTGSPGIQFPAGTAGTGVTIDNNLLDDYEEGSWTPKFFNNANSSTTENINNNAIYTKIGRQVTVHAQIKLTSKGSTAAATGVTIDGLPFPVKNKQSSAPSGSIGFFSNLVGSSGITSMTCSAAFNTSHITLRKITSAVDSETVSLLASDCQEGSTSGFKIIFSLTYETD